MDFYKPRGRNSDLDENKESKIRVTDRRRSFLEDDANSGAAVTAESPNLKPSYVAELEARTEAAEKLTQEVQSRFEKLRTQLQRETDETRQRLNRAADERAERGKADFIAGLLPVLDNLQRATEAAESGGTPEQIGEGVRRTAASFENALAAAGVEPLQSVGQEFDPELHEAVETVPVEPEEEGKVVAEFSRGYRIGDRLLRPASVKVGRSSPRMRTAGE
ncbi:MAG: nucleotide exchange factor GrpE [Pyrinomonadaceae bacterium]|nr:nucleotide exchange factor GrpE [Pyrinomonadaceae bacterium]